MRARHDRPSTPAPSAAAPSAPSAPGARPANRAERRAAARGRDLAATPGGSGAGHPVPGTSGPGVQVKPRHTRTDYAARRSG